MQDAQLPLSGRPDRQVAWLSALAKGRIRRHRPWTVRITFARAALTRPSLASGGGRPGAGCPRFSSACHRSTNPNQNALSLALRAAAARRRHSSARRWNSSCDLVRTTLKGRASSSMGGYSILGIRTEHEQKSRTPRTALDLRKLAYVFVSVVFRPRARIHDRSWRSRTPSQEDDAIAGG
jgi:hypothetical protein